MDSDEHASGRRRKECLERIVEESKNDKRIKDGKWIGYRRKRKLVNQRNCKFCGNPFGGRSDKKFCTRKCANLDWLDRHPEYFDKIKGSKNKDLISLPELKLMAIRMLKRS